MNTRIGKNAPQIPNLQETELQGTQRKPFERIADDTKVKDVKTLQNRTPHVVRDFGHLTVGELRARFGGLTVSKIGRMSAAGRAATLGAWGMKQFDNANLASVGSMLGAALGFTDADIKGARPQALIELGVAHLEESTEALFQDLKAKHSGTAEWRWSDTKNTTFVINQLPYPAEVSLALNVAFEADRLGDSAKAVALYDQVIALDPGNADAINRRGIALGHLASEKVAKTSPGNESRNKRRDAVRLQGQANDAYRQVIDMGAQAGIFDVKSNTLQIPNLHKMLGNPQVEGLFAAVAKAQYNLAVGLAKTEMLEGHKPLANNDVLAALSRVGGVSADLSGAQVAFKQVNADNDYEHSYNAALQGLLGRLEQLTENLGPRLAGFLSEDGDLKSLRGTSSFNNAVNPPGRD